MKNTKRSKLASLLLMSLFLISIKYGNVGAAYYSDRQDGRVWHSAVGIKVVDITLHASGYSNSNSGSVTGVWFTHWVLFPNFTRDPVTWTEKTPNGEWAKGTMIRGAGIDSPIGVIGGTTSEYFQILF